MCGTHRCSSLAHYTMFFSVSVCMPCRGRHHLNVNNTDLMYAFNLFIIYLFIMQKPALLIAHSTHKLPAMNHDLLFYYITENSFVKDFSTPSWDEPRVSTHYLFHFGSGQIYVNIFSFRTDLSSEFRRESHLTVSSISKRRPQPQTPAIRMKVQWNLLAEIPWVAVMLMIATAIHQVD